MTNKESPAMMPGVCARGIDANHNDYTATHTPEQVKAAMSKFYAEEVSKHTRPAVEDQLILIAYCSGYAPDFPVLDAYETAVSIVNEERKRNNGRIEK